MPIDPSQAADFIQTVGFPAAVAVATIVTAAAALWFLHKAHQAEIARLVAAHAAELSRLGDDHQRELRDKTAGAEAWKQLFERADSERQANGRELAEQLKTLDIALELVQQQGRR